MMGAIKHRRHAKGSNETVRQHDGAYVRSVLVLSVGVFMSAFASADAVNQVDYGSLVAPYMANLSIFPTGSYDQILTSDDVSLAERFVDQTLTSVDIQFPPGTDNTGIQQTFDQLGPIVTAPLLPPSQLSLQIGLPGQNIAIFDLTVYPEYKSTATSVFGKAYSPGFTLGHPGQGEIFYTGSVAMLFASDQSRVGFALVGGDQAPYDGGVFVNFFRRDGSLIYSFSEVGTLYDPGVDFAHRYFGFERDGGIADIAGISIYNTDAMGLGYYDFKYNVSSVPEPASAALWLAGMLGIAAACRRKTRRQAVAARLRHPPLA